MGDGVTGIVVTFDCPIWVSCCKRMQGLHLGMVKHL
jgi:hypothetical protein